MKLCDLNPHLRFASQITYYSHKNNVRVTDCRIFYVLSGSAEINIENKHYVLAPNCLFFCCGGSEYELDAPDGFTLISLNFDLSQICNTFLQPFVSQPRTANVHGIKIIHEDIENSPFLNSHFYLQDGRILFHYIEKIISEFSSNVSYFREMCSSTLKELLLELHRVHNTTAPSKIELIIKYIESNYAKDINNKDLAAMAGYHEYHLNRLFMAHTGTNLHNYLLKVRLNQASHLILNTDIPLKAIPEEVGFHSYPHFSSYFKQHFGFSPAQYRKELRNNI